MPEFRNNRPLLALWTGQGFSLLGSGIFATALAWEVTRLTGSALTLGTILLAVMLPKLIFSFLGGAFGDRYSKRTILIIADVSRLIIALIWGLSLLGRTPTMIELYGFSVFYGLAHAFFTPAYGALLPELITKEQISRAVSINQLVFKLSGILGAVAGGVLVAQFSLGWVVVFDALTYLLALCSDLFLPKEAGSYRGRPSTSLFADIGSGFRYFVNHRIIFWSVVLITLANVAVVSFEVNLPALIQFDLSWDAEVYGFVIAWFGIGSLLSYLFLSFYTIRRFQGLTYLVTLMIGGGCLALVRFTSVPLTLAGSLLVMGVAFAVTSTLSTRMVQELTDEQYRSRVMGIARISGLLNPIGFLLWGAIGDLFGNPFVFLLAGVIVVVVAVGGFFTRLSSYQ